MQQCKGYVYQLVVTMLAFVSVALLADVYKITIKQTRTSAQAFPILVFPGTQGVVSFQQSIRTKLRNDPPHMNCFVR